MPVLEAGASECCTKEDPRASQEHQQHLEPEVSNDCTHVQDEAINEFQQHADNLKKRLFKSDSSESDISALGGPQNHANIPARAQVSNRTGLIRETKRLVQARIRNDWSWPCRKDTLKELIPEFDHCNVIEWRERESEDENSKGLAGDVKNTGNAGDQEQRVLSYPTLEAARDAISSEDIISSVSRQGKKRRREELHEELKYNQGLCLWHERRDAFTGAQVVSSLSLFSPLSDTRVSTSGPDWHGASGPTENIPEVSESSSRTTDSSLCLVPVMASLIPKDHPVRASITPAARSSIYSKVIIQSLTPSIPINLADVVTALVNGWKEDGEWPAKSELSQDRNQAEMRHSQIDKNVPHRIVHRSLGKVKRALGVHSPHHDT